MESSESISSRVMMFVRYRRGCSPLLPVGGTQQSLAVISNFPFSRPAHLFRAKSFFPAATPIHRRPGINEGKFITCPYVTVLQPNMYFLLLTLLHQPSSSLDCFSYSRLLSLHPFRRFYAIFYSCRFASDLEFYGTVVFWFFLRGLIVWGLLQFWKMVFLDRFVGFLVKWS